MLASYLYVCVWDHGRCSLRRWGTLAPLTEKNVWLAKQCVFFISSDEQKKICKKSTYIVWNLWDLRFSPRLISNRTGARIAYDCDHDWLWRHLHIGAVWVLVFIVLLSATRARNIWYHSACSCRPSNESIIRGLDCDIDTVALDKLGSSAITLILH